MSGWLSPSTIAGLTIAAVFAIIVVRNPYRGLLWFVALASIPVLEVGAFSGLHQTQGLMMAEVLATVLILVWFATRPSLPSAGREVTEPLLAFLAVACLSLATGYVFYDPAIDVAHLNATVSLGQILLFCWPIGIYLVTAGVVTKVSQAGSLVRLMQGLSLLQLAMRWVPTGPSLFLSWTWYFGLFAAPFSFAEMWDTRSWARRAALALLALAPLAKAVVDGRAFIYISISVALLVVTGLKLGRRAVLPLSAMACAYALFVVVSGTWVPPLLDTLVEVERAQRSLGGPTGRGALLADALSIWLTHPLLGVGPGNNYPYMLRYSTIGTPHNQYANILLEGGAIGLLVFLEFVRRAIMFGLRVRREAQTPGVRWIATGWLGLFIGLISGAVAGDFIFHSVRNGGIVFFSQFYQQWVLLGVVAALDRRRQSQLQPQEAQRLYPWTRHRRVPSAA